MYWRDLLAQSKLVKDFNYVHNLGNLSVVLINFFVSEYYFPVLRLFTTILSIVYITFVSFPVFAALLDKVLKPG